MQNKLIKGIIIKKNCKEKKPFEINQTIYSNNVKFRSIFETENFSKLWMKTVTDLIHT